MKTRRSALQPVLVALACASISACANNPPPQADLNDRTPPSPTTQGANRTPSPSGQRLTIQTGEGEKLDLPWFVRDTQDWINSK
ncbi:hypothetical protein [Candidimonas nitroreducens]|uniref:Uncharacterized protein n=1 Tax=Candidimonas nitroreducens TaxID=683354 RepID=A0A225MKZ3_9BURK|nr:hypothetical protein [Candidimonas nitroreducens]OWT61865.1 hypothetical protein CEY11_08510 [Candidimonas nitroreducens]